MDFEQAAVIRDRLKALTFIQGSQAINAEGLGDADIFALACRGGSMCIQAFFIRGGQNWGHRSFFPVHTADVPEDEVLASFMAQFYEEVPPPRLILSDRAPAECELMALALSERIGSKVRIEVPRRGDRTRLIKQAQRNAVEALERQLAETTTQAKVLNEMVEIFGLDGVPDRIEVYDNSHIQGAHALGGMVVAGPEGFRRQAYRKFNIKQAATNDDFAMMREMFERRFGRAAREDPDRDGGEWPDLVLIAIGRPRDAGGYGHRGCLHDRHRQGPAPRPRGARGLPPARRPRNHPAAQPPGVVLYAAAPRRGA
jgi:excinuclease ABC subunit C